MFYVCGESALRCLWLYCYVLFFATHSPGSAASFGCILGALCAMYRSYIHPNAAAHHFASHWQMATCGVEERGQSFHSKTPGNFPQLTKKSSAENSDLRSLTEKPLLPEQTLIVCAPVCVSVFQTRLTVGTSATAINCTSYSQNGQLLLTGASDGYIRIYGEENFSQRK